MFEIILGQVPEAIYFSLFMILIKEFKTRRVIFTLFMLVLYLGLKSFLPYDLKFQFFYIFGSYIIMKGLYGNKVQITDVFLFGVASIILMISSSLAYLISLFTIQGLTIAIILKNIFVFITLFLTKDKIKYFYKKYRNNWNRKPGLKIKSLTVRNASLVTFNIMLFLIGLVLMNKEFFMTLLN